MSDKTGGKVVRKQFFMKSREVLALTLGKMHGELFLMCVQALNFDPS